MEKMPLKARLYVSLIVAVGFGLLVDGLFPWASQYPGRYACYFLMSAVGAGLKLTLPGVQGTMSANFLFIILGTLELTLPETLLAGCVASVVQCVWKAKSRIRLERVAFSTAVMAIAIRAAYFTYHFVLGTRLPLTAPVILALSATTLFAVNTLPIAIIIALTENKRFGKVWKECYFFSFPYYLIAAGIAGLINTLSHVGGWQVSSLVLPVIYWIYRSYRLYLDRLESEKKHVEEVASLHLRTIEALALAIEAKDRTTHAHLQRVRVYACEIGKDLGLGETELDALHAAALLHDIGKLAVPEHIISKPGRLTPAEFDKMKIHPVVGAEILERVEFPYPVAPIVRAHHEKWDGTGYPAGLREEQIPIGARILSAVDCLDALASDRQYRRALPLDEAMAVVVSESGKSFDPQVVEVLKRRYIELEHMAQAQPARQSTLSRDVRIERGLAPAAGFEKTERAAPAGPAAKGPDFLSSIADAREEAQMLFELTQTLGTSLSLDETLSVLALRLKRMIPYDCIAVYLRREDKLLPAYVSGENHRLFSSLEIPIGEGLSGWVAGNGRPIINGNPSVEPGYLNDPGRFSTLRSALSIPLEGIHGVVGVLTLYHSARDFFTKDHHRILLAITEKVALSVENALRYRQAETCATTDALTGLPNARSLFLHLDRELARCKRLKLPLGVLVCDLDGFKQVNDRFGHLQGNKVLQAVAQGLQGACREYDYVARMGGDEFVVVLPGYRPEAVESKALRLKEATEEAGREVHEEDPVSVSIGVAFYPDDGPDAEQLLAEADRRMYKAKHLRASRVALSNALLWETATVQ